MLVRSLLVDRLTNLGIRSPTRLVDAALCSPTRAKHATAQGRALLFDDLEPWPTEVDGAALLEDLRRIVRRYVALPEDAAMAAVLWIVHAHAFEATNISPFLALVSPVKRCGKTTLLDVVGALVPRKLPAANISVAALFRTVESDRPTLLIDEADTFLAHKDELRGMLNAGHTSTTAAVIRIVGEDFLPRKFSTWCPKFVASIGRLPGTIEDRSIVIQMRRRMPGETVARLRRDRLDTDMEPFRRQAMRWATDHLDELREAEPAVPEVLHDRAQDNWRFLLAIAEAAGGEWPDLARRAATFLSASVLESDSSSSMQLLVDLRDLAERAAEDQIASKEIVDQLSRLDGRPWSDWRHGRSLSTNQLAKLLSPFGVRPRTIRLGPSTAKGYRLLDLDDVFRRYLSSEPSQPEQARNGDSIDHSTNGNTPRVTDSQGCEKAENEGLVTPVTVAGVGSVEDSRPVELVAHENPTRPIRPCYACKGTQFWAGAEGHPVCLRCHPPASEDLVQRRLGV
jgi:putative DNA primase/helicase